MNNRAQVDIHSFLQSYQGKQLFVTYYLLPWMRQSVKNGYKELKKSLELQKQRKVFALREGTLSFKILSQSDGRQKQQMAELPHLTDAREKF